MYVVWIQIDLLSEPCCVIPQNSNCYTVAAQFRLPTLLASSEKTLLNFIETNNVQLLMNPFLREICILHNLLKASSGSPNLLLVLNYYVAYRAQALVLYYIG